MLPVEDYTLPGGVHRNVGDWAACDACADALRGRDWNKVKYRAKKAAEARGGPRMAPQVYDVMYSQLRQHVTGQVHLLAQSPGS